MSNMPNFYVYCRETYSVWEPAEGGYYVPATRITYCESFNFLEDAYDDLLEGIMNVVSDGYKICNGSWYCGFKTMDGETYLVFPWFICEYDGYISERFEIGITTDKPEDEPYMGYC